MPDKPIFRVLLPKLEAPSLVSVLARELAPDFTYPEVIQALVDLKAMSLLKIWQAPGKVASVPRFESEKEGAFLVSFPKSGRTWLRIMLDAADILPSYTHDRSAHLYKLHLKDMGRSKIGYRDQRVLLLVRNPLDTVVSGYFQATKRLGVYSETLSDFIRDPGHGIEKIVVFNCDWFAAAPLPAAFGLIQYEELHACAREVLARVIRFFESPFPLTRIDELIERGRFETMQASERDRTLSEVNGYRITPGNPCDPESFHCRKGQVGGYRDYLSADDVTYCQQVLRQYNYDELLEQASRQHGLIHN